MDGFLFLSHYLDIFMVVGYLLLLLSTFTLIMVAHYHVRQVAHLNKQVDYWRQTALTQNKSKRK
jgi:hypothetical protein|tara:strand:+ start:996 stop:1187 length:192 start_codon:yes stop_codon:yes gene_type:complete